jgi:hypothetical protein
VWWFHWFSFDHVDTGQVGQLWSKLVNSSRQRQSTDSLTSQTFMRSPINSIGCSCFLMAFKLKIQREKWIVCFLFISLTFDRSGQFHGKMFHNLTVIGSVSSPSTFTLKMKSWSVKSAHFVPLLEQISSDSVDSLIFYRISSVGDVPGTAQKSRHFEFYRRLLVPVMVMGGRGQTGVAGDSKPPKICEWH